MTNPTTDRLAEVLEALKADEMPGERQRHREARIVLHSLLNKAHDLLQSQQAEIERLREALGGLCDSLDALIDHSEGVTGLHLNGDVAPWTSLLDGGAFEPWLMALSDARTALNPQPGKDICK